MAQQYQYTDIPPARPNSTMAIISLVTGILGLTLVPVIGGVVALITGYMAKREIRDSGGALGGDGLATAGIVMGWIAVGLAILGGCLLILIPLCVLIFSIGTSNSSGLIPLLLHII